MKSNSTEYSCDQCLQNFKSVFTHLTEDEFNQLNFDKNCEFFKKGSILYHEGSRLTNFYCIHSGIVKIYKTGSEGKEQIIRFAKKGDIIGYRSILNGDLACTSAKILEDAALCSIPASTLHNLVQNNSSFSYDMLQLVCNELGEANSFITDIAQKTVRERLAEVLILLKSSFGVDDDNVLKISLTREELANLVGTATESVIRLLSDFKSENYIELKGRKIKILNEAALVRVGNIYD